MPLKPVALVGFAALALAACASANVPAPPAGKFADLRLDDTHFQISFHGDESDSRAQVNRYLMLRAAQLALGAGYDWFEMSGPRGGADAWRPTWTYHRAPGFEPFGGPAMGAYSVTGVDGFLASAVILVGRGAPPGNTAGAYDARAVVADLGGKVTEPS